VNQCKSILTSRFRGDSILMIKHVGDMAWFSWQNLREHGWLLPPLYVDKRWKSWCSATIPIKKTILMKLSILAQAGSAHWTSEHPCHLAPWKKRDHRTQASSQTPQAFGMSPLSNSNSPTPRAHNPSPQAAHVKMRRVKWVKGIHQYADLLFVTSNVI
jgi:hypothetical protein